MGGPPGRPPIGKVAMSATERWRRHRDRLRPAKPDEPAITIATATLERDLTQAKARIAELEGALEQARQSASAAGVATMAQRPSSDGDLRTLHKRTATDKQIEKAKRIGDLEKEIARLNKVLFDNEQRAEIARIRRECQQEIRRRLQLHDAHVRKHTFVMDNATFNKIRAGLHEDSTNKDTRHNAFVLLTRYAKFVLDRKTKPKR
jgi:hypothetical protein